MKYYVNAIRNEQDREIGASMKYGPYNSLDDCNEDAEKLHVKGYLYVEVINNAGEVYYEYEN
jgi:hypothetical protein